MAERYEGVKYGFTVTSEGFDDLIQRYPQEFAELWDVGRTLGTRKLVRGHGGNMSIRVGGGFLISATGIHLARIQYSQIVFIDLTTGVDFDAFAIRNAVGHLPPSSEAILHARIYHLTSARAILHIHRFPRFVSKRLPFLSYGTKEAADKIAHALIDTDAVIVEKHGVFIRGETLSDILTRF